MTSVSPKKELQTSECVLKPLPTMLAVLLFISLVSLQAGVGFERRLESEEMDEVVEAPCEHLR